MDITYASNGKANAALTTGIIGTALGVLSGGMGFFGNNSAAANSNYVTKDELKMVQDISAKDAEIALLKADQESEIKMTEVYRQAHNEIAALRDTVTANYNSQQSWNASQSVANAQMSAAIATNTASIAALNSSLGGITKTIVPITSVCPEPMKMYNSWTAPTSSSSTT